MEALVLRIQALVDRWSRWLRLSSAPSAPSDRRFLIVQIDGLSRAALEQGLDNGSLRNLARLLADGQLVRRDLSVGLPSSTPAFQAAIMYGGRPDIPGFHFLDKRTGRELHFPHRGVADFVEERHAAGRPGILEDGSCYGCVFTGGAANALWTFARLGRLARAGRGVRRALLSSLLLLWVALKCVVLTAGTLARFLGRIVLSLAAGRPEVRWSLEALMLDVGVSIWARELFTLLVSADLYCGTRAISVNFIDYDVFAHAYGPRDRLAFRALRRVDRSIQQLARIVRRLPELGYDLYVLSDHGQVETRTFQSGPGDPSLDEVVREALGEAPAGLRVIAAGPNAFVYFTDRPEPLVAAEIEARHPRALARLSRHPRIALVLVRGPRGPECWYRGHRVALGARPDPAVRDPFARRPDRDVVVADLRELMAMPSAGDIVLYGTGAPGRATSFIPERGAHAGPAEEEMHTFICHPPGVRLPDGALTHPRQLYPHFRAYRGAAREARRAPAESAACLAR